MYFCIINEIKWLRKKDYREINIQKEIKSAEKCWLVFCMIWQN